MARTSRENNRVACRKYYRKNRKKLLGEVKRYYFKNKKRKAAYGRRRYEKLRGSILLRKYGITEDGYSALFQAQQGKCAICREVSRRRLHVDHDHSSGRVRGLLCARCNFCLGYARDKITILKSAISYLTR